ncbi:hypothetical protein PpBr36_00315 [Pyricularia pennisetigena]|uniref:hypothetical protein n=1 Tax=Pyricularia pennisetigena TaxID=1578925 RepID=UPI00114E0FE7|nr:hypothetical protein PpBr36_00315 [Pyricularia pennisetigena]TLS27732.1 hypothetical protein PpBr36_00315 [Pyricularia pennisetigena]
MSKKFSNMFALKTNGEVASWFLDTDDRRVAQIRLDELVRLRDEEYGIKQPLNTPQTKGSVPFRPRELSDLKGNPTQLLFARLHEEWELNDAWYSSTFMHLFTTIKYFSQRYFGMDVFPEGFSPWKEGNFSQIFLDFVNQVACPDPTANWDALLMESKQKSSLVCGVFTKALLDTVFTSLLFGASDEQMTLLKTHDETTLELDGYKRTARRGAIVRDFLGDDITTPRFWTDVGQLSTEITEIFLPLINLQGQAAPQMEWPELTEIHQQIFHIVSIAAYFSVIIRRSETIFDYFMAPVGSEWAHTHEEENPGIYHNSRLAATAQDDDDEARAKVENSLTEARAQQFDGLLSLVRDIMGSNKVVEYRRPIRTAKVGIAMFPRIKRHRTLCDPEQWNKWTVEHESLVFKGRVTYYYGKEHDPLGLEQKPSLDEYRMTKWEKFWAKHYSPRHWLLLSTLALLLLHLWQPLVFRNLKAALYAFALLVVVTVKKVCEAPLRIPAPIGPQPSPSGIQSEYVQT